MLDGRLSLGDLMMFLVYLAMLLEPMAVLATSVHPAPEQPGGLRPRARPAGRAPRDGRPPRRTGVVRKSAVAGPDHARGRRLPLSGDRRAWCCATSTSTSSRARRSPWSAAAARARRRSATWSPGSTTRPRGVIRLDGVDLRDIEVESYRRLLGIVEQDVFLFDGTIAENIAYADRRARSGRGRARGARWPTPTSSSRRLPDGYDTLIGERGVKLSGGQRQRLAIARAVLADPRIFILDEATSNLDTESERLIQQSLEALLRGRTSFVIAHRLSTIRHADRILVLEAGAIVEAGSHAELMAAQRPLPRHGRAAACGRRGLTRRPRIPFNLPIRPIPPMGSFHQPPPTPVPLCSGPQQRGDQLLEDLPVERVGRVAPVQSRREGDVRQVLRQRLRVCSKRLWIPGRVALGDCSPRGRVKEVTSPPPPPLRTARRMKRGHY